MHQLGRFEPKFALLRGELPLKKVPPTRQFDGPLARVERVLPARDPQLLTDLADHPPVPVPVELPVEQREPEPPLLPEPFGDRSLPERKPPPGHPKPHRRPEVEEKRPEEILGQSKLRPLANPLDRLQLTGLHQPREHFAQRVAPPQTEHEALLEIVAQELTVP